MSGNTSQSTYEKLVATVLVIGMAAAGWGPFVFEALKLPFIERFLLPASLALAVLSLGLLYDATERLLGGNRGLYAAAILTTLPASGMVITDPGWLADAALMLICAVGIWMASRAKSEERPFFLAFIAVLLMAAGYGSGFQPGAAALLFVAWIAARQGSRVTVWMVVLVLCYSAGAAVHAVAPLMLPVPDTILPPESRTLWDYLLPHLPWSLFIIPALWLLVKKKAPAWWLEAAASPLLVVVASLFSEVNPAAPVAAAAPVIALLGADLLFGSFRADSAPAYRNVLTIPVMLTAALLLALPLLSATGTAAAPVINLPGAIAAALLAAALAVSFFARRPRWVFVIFYAAGILFGRIANQIEPLFRQPGEMGPEPVSPALALLLIAAAIGVSLMAWFLSRRSTSSTGNPDYRYGGEHFRVFSDDKAPTVSLDGQLSETYNFAIFGDVSGAESPFSSRRSGYLAFRALAKELGGERFNFALSLGDLSSQATASAYRRVRALVKQIRLPLAVTPGNHDLFAGGRYDSSHFHALFGDDNATFRIGPVQYVILNNAWGGIAEPQFAWLEETLRSSGAPFKLVFCHKPVFEFREDKFYAMEDQDCARRMHDLFRAHGVTAVFSGHIHTLLSAARDGVNYIISGGGGSKPTSPRDRYHYLTVSVTPSEIRVQAIPLAETDRSDKTPLLELRFSTRL